MLSERRSPLFLYIILMYVINWIILTVYNQSCFGTLGNCLSPSLCFQHARQRIAQPNLLRSRFRRNIQCQRLHHRLYDIKRIVVGHSDNRRPADRLGSCFFHQYVIMKRPGKVAGEDHAEQRNCCGLCALMDAASLDQVKQRLQMLGGKIDVFDFI